MCVCVGGGGGLKDEMGEIEGEVGGGNLKVRYGGGGELKTRCGQWKGRRREGKWTPPPPPSLAFRQLSSRSTPWPIRMMYRCEM